MIYSFRFFLYFYYSFLMYESAIASSDIPLRILTCRRCWYVMRPTGGMLV